MKTNTQSNYIVSVNGLFQDEIDLHTEALKQFQDEIRGHQTGKIIGFSREYCQFLEQEILQRKKRIEELQNRGYIGRSQQELTITEEN